METHPVVMADASGEIRHWSAAAERAFGYAATYATGRMLELIIPPEYRGMHQAGFGRAMETGEAAVDQQTTEFPVLMADGRVVPWRGRVILLRDARESTIGALVIFDAAAVQDSGGKLDS